MSNEFYEIERTWSEDSGEYDELVRRQLSNKKDVAHWMHELSSVLGEKPLRILDVGCGPGFLSILLSRLGHEVKAIDGAEGMVSFANRNFRAAGVSVRAYLEDAVTLPDEQEESYDIVISRDVVWTLYDPEQAFLRWKSVLKPGGQMIFYDGDYQKRKHSKKVKLWKAFSALLILLTEHKRIQNGTDGGAFDRLPMVSSKRPEKDIELLRKTGFRKFHVSMDRYRNSITHPEYWKYGYQGKKFRVVAWKSSRPSNTSRQ